MRRAVWLSLTLLAASGCLAPTARECASDDECSLDGKMGRCAAIGYCAYANADCELGFSYGPYAPTGIANACIAAEAVSSSSSSSGESEGTGGACPTGCSSLLAEEFGRWPLSTELSLIDAAVLDDGSIVVAGGDGSDTKVLNLSTGDASDLPGLELRGLASSGEHVYVGGNQEDRPVLVALSGALEQRWTRSWSTSREDILVGLGTSASGGPVIGGLAWGRPWVEQLDSDGDRVWLRQWDADISAVRPEAVVAQGGVTLAVGHNDAQALYELEFGPAGEATTGKLLASDFAGPVVDTDISAAGVALAGSGWVLGHGHGAEPSVMASVELDVAAVVFDASNRLVVASQSPGLPLEVSVFDGETSQRMELTTESIDGVAATAHLDGFALIIAQVGEEVVAWHVP